MCPEWNRVSGIRQWVRGPDRSTNIPLSSYVSTFMRRLQLQVINSSHRVWNIRDKRKNLKTFRTLHCFTISLYLFYSLNRQRVCSKPLVWQLRQKFRSITKTIKSSCNVRHDKSILSQYPNLKRQDYPEYHYWSWNRGLYRTWTSDKGPGVLIHNITYILRSVSVTVAEYVLYDPFSLRPGDTTT